MAEKKCTVFSFCHLPLTSESKMELPLSVYPKTGKYGFAQTLHNIKAQVQQKFNLEPNSFFLCPSNSFIPCQSRIGHEVALNNVDPTKGLYVFPSPKSLSEGAEQMMEKPLKFRHYEDSETLDLHFSPCSTLAEIFFIIMKHCEKINSQTAFTLYWSTSLKSFNILPSELFRTYLRHGGPGVVLIYKPKIQTKEVGATEETNEVDEVQEIPQPSSSPIIHNNKKRSYEELEEAYNEAKALAKQYKRLYELEQQKVQSLIQ